MKTRIASLVVAALAIGVGVSRADFKYSESAKITGGAMAGMMKMVGAFSKQAREPVVSTTSVKGNRLRREQPEGRVEIIDLDGRRIISLDTQKQTYTVVSFDDMRAALEREREKAQKQSRKSEANVKVVPKLQVTPTENTKVILNQTTHEVKVRLDMEMQAQDAQQQKQSASYSLSSDSWVAPSVKGYEELNQFYLKMSKELNWLPGAAFGANPQMADAMAELRKNLSEIKGFPLLQYTSFGIEGMGQAGASTASAQQSSGGGSQTSQSTQSAPEINPGGAIAKGIGGMFGGFGKKKKKEEQQQPQQSQQPQQTQQPQQPPTTSTGSLMDMTVEVTSYSNGPLDSSLFEIPAGYTQVQGDGDKMLQGRR